jgi:hypothetical protein
MQYEAAVKCSFNPTTGHRYSLYLTASDSSLEFALPLGSGAYNHIVTEFLRDVDWTKWDKAFSHCGSFQTIRAIELDEDDINHLTRFCVEQV